MRENKRLDECHPGVHHHGNRSRSEHVMHKYLHISVGLQKHTTCTKVYDQNDLSDICGFAAWVCFAPPIPPTACLIDISNLSLVVLGSVPVASLNATGADVAYDRRCVIPCVCNMDGGEQFGSSTSAAVGSSTHNNRTPRERI